MNLPKKCGLLLSIFLLVAGPVSADWDTAMAAFDEGEFETAYEMFLALRGPTHTSAALEFNLGNSAFRKGRPDIALAHYRLARWITPNNPDLRENQQMAADILASELPDLPAARRISAFLPHPLWRALWFASLWFLALYGLAMHKWQKLRGAAPWVMPLTLFLILSFGAGVRASGLEPALREAVVLGEEATVRFEPHETATAHYELPGGSLVEVETHTRQWTRVRHGGRSGWILREQLHPVALTEFE